MRRAGAAGVALALGVAASGVAVATASAGGDAVATASAGGDAPAPSGAVFAWGDDDAGQIGNGTLSTAANHDEYDPPVPVPANMPAGSVSTSIAGGQSSSLAVTSNGAVYSWGFNNFGQLGTGNTVATTSPVPVSMPAGVQATAVAAGYKQSMALSTGGAVYTWGDDQDGEDGNGKFTHGLIKPYHLTLPGGVTATAIATGTDHDLAVTSAGAVYDWGLNSTGQLGDGSTTNSDVPVEAQLPANVTATAVAGSASHSLALTSTGAVYAWGDNSYGQLGDGSTVEAQTPVKVDLPAGVVATAVQAGDGSDNGLDGGYSLALTSTGAIYAWGNNASSDLGDGSTTNSDVPVLVHVPTGVTPIAITAGGNRCHLLTSAETIYDWGTGETGGDLRSVPTLDIMPPGETPVAIGDGPDAEQYLALMVPTP